MFLSITGGAIELSVKDPADPMLYFPIQEVFIWMTIWIILSNR